MQLALIIMICTLSQISADIFTPSLPALSKYFGQNLNSSQMTIAFYMIALVLTKLIWGPLSDTFGRKKILIAGLIVGLLGALICALAPNLMILYVGRIIQGIGNGAAAGLWRAVFRDMYEGKNLARVASYLGNSVVMVIAIAPMLGGYLQDFSGWRGSFWFLFYYSLLITLLTQAFFRENHEKSPHVWLKSYAMLLKSPAFMGACFCNFFSYAGLFAWITLGSTILIDNLGLTPVEFGNASLLCWLGMFIGSTLNGKLIQKFGYSFMLRLGYGLILLAGVLILSLGYFELTYAFKVISIFALTGLYFAGSAMTYPNTYAIAFADFGKIAGVASGLYAFIQTAGGAFSSTLFAFITTSSPSALGIAYACSALISWLIYELVVANARNQRI